MHPDRNTSQTAPKNLERLATEFLLYAAALLPLASLISGASFSFRPNVYRHLRFRAIQNRKSRQGL
jgi:hypothetical protein